MCFLASLASCISSSTQSTSSATRRHCARYRDPWRKESNVTMTGRPSHPREDSSSSQPHRPAQPSTLRQSYTPPSRPGSDGSNQGDDASPSSSRPVDGAADESTPLIQPNSFTTSTAHPGACNHGTFSPRAATPPNDLSHILDASEEDNNSEGLFSHTTGNDDWKQWLKSRMKTKKMGQSSEIAERAGFRDTPLM